MSKPHGLVRPEGLGKFKNSPHRVSNSRPSGLYHRALTTTLPRASPRDGIIQYFREGEEVLSTSGVDQRV
jgi:hypothetical protein